MFRCHFSSYFLSSPVFLYHRSSCSPSCVSPSVKICSLVRDHAICVLTSIVFLFADKDLELYWVLWLRIKFPALRTSPYALSLAPNTRYGCWLLIDYTSGSSPLWSLILILKPIHHSNIDTLVISSKVISLFIKLLFF